MVKHQVNIPKNILKTINSLFFDLKIVWLFHDMLYQKQKLKKFCCIFWLTANTYIKVALGISPQFFSIWTRVLNHNKYVKIKQFSKEDIKQNNISTVILLIMFLVYQWDPRHLQGSRVVYIFIYTLYSCSI